MTCIDTRDEDIELPAGWRLVWRAHPVSPHAETRSVLAAYDTVSGYTDTWKCPDRHRHEGWAEPDTEPIRYIPDPAPDSTRKRRHICRLVVTRGGRVVGVAVSPT